MTLLGDVILFDDEIPRTSYEENKEKKGWN